MFQVHTLVQCGTCVCSIPVARLGLKYMYSRYRVNDRAVARVNDKAAARVKAIGLELKVGLGLQ